MNPTDNSSRKLITDILTILNRPNDWQRLIHDIEKRERELVNLRGNRDECFRRAAEMRVAANILRKAGLRSEMTDRGPFVSVDGETQP